MARWRVLVLPGRPRVTYGLGTALGRLKGIAEKLLRDKQFALAVECSERALEVLTDNREFQAIRAKAKMLMERKTPDQRSIIFQQQDRNKDCGLAIPDSDTDRSAPVTDDLEMIKSTPAKTTNEISDGLLTPPLGHS